MSDETTANEQIEGSRLLCVKCGGSVVKARVNHNEGNVVLRPLKVKFLYPRFSRLIAQTCTNCGYTEFYAEDPKSVLN